MTYDKPTAQRYESDPEHMLHPEEAQAWLRVMHGVSDADQHRGKLLDVGAGTGLLTFVMKDAGYDVVGLEPSGPMIAEALTRNPSLSREDFIEGDAGEAGLFPPETFDWIVSRQVLCHLRDPRKIFAVWHSWLKPGGHAVLVDGFWSRTSWSDADLQSPPLAALTDVQPVVDAMTVAQFVVIRAAPFEDLNEARRARWSNSVQRYLFIGRREH